MCFHKYSMLVCRNHVHSQLVEVEKFIPVELIIASPMIKVNYAHNYSKSVATSPQAFQIVIHFQLISAFEICKTSNKPVEINAKPISH